MYAAPTALSDRASRELLLEATSDAIFSVDLRSGLVLGANPRLEAVVGRPLAQLLGKPVSSLTPQDGDGRETAFGPDVWGHPGLHEDVLLARADGFTAQVTVRVAHVRVNDAHVAVCVARDETERRMLERELITKHVALQSAHEELTEKVDELRELSRVLEERRREITELSSQIASVSRRAMLAEVVAEVAHSLNNPLGALTSSLRMLGRFEPEVAESGRDRYRTLVTRCRSAADRMALVVEELRIACRTGTRRDSVCTLDVTEEIESALSLVRPRVSERVELVTTLDSGVMACASAADLQHAVLNLVDNALHAVGHAGTVHITCRERDGAAVIEVADSGPGIAEEHLAGLFEPFFTTKPKGQGTGLGLSMVRRMANRYGGAVEVEPHGPLGGAVFRVRLGRGSRG